MRSRDVTRDRGTGAVDPELEELCRREYPRLVGALTLYVGERTVAEQLAQDALLRLCQQWPRVRGFASPAAWLQEVGLNLGRSWWRRYYAERRAWLRHGVVDVVHDPDSADAVAVRQAVGGLPERQRLALILRFYEQLPIAHVAARMGCAEGTVKALTHQAVSTLRRQFAMDDQTDQREEEVLHG